MKKAILLVSILFVAVFSTACINNFAVQELNAKAKAYMDKGDYAGAIERLKSSIDLDDTIFETHYNLAVAYTQSEDYASAIESYKKAIEINPDIADTYYSLAVAEGNLAVDLKSGAVILNEDNTISKSEEIDEEFTPNEETIDMIDSLKAQAIENYQIYLEKNPASSDSAEVKAKIKELQGNDITIAE